MSWIYTLNLVNTSEFASTKNQKICRAPESMWSLVHVLSSKSCFLLPYSLYSEKYQENSKILQSTIVLTSNTRN